MNGKKLALRKLIDAELFRDHRIRQKTVDEFLEELKDVEAVLPGPKQNLHAILVTFMEWVETKKRIS